jgi:urease accessory protein
MPDHLIPFPGSALRQSLTIEMAEGSSALVYDAFATGRVVRGEKWEFKELVNKIALKLNGRLIFLDCFKLDRSVWKLAGLGGMENFGYVATFGLFSATFSDWNGLAAVLQQELKSISRGGVSLLARHGCVVRMLAHSAIQLGDAARRIWAVARQKLLHLPPRDLRKF